MALEMPSSEASKQLYAPLWMRPVFANTYWMARSYEHIQDALSNSADQHKLSPSMQRLADFAFEWEGQTIAARRSIPLGAGCIAVAKAV